jgi:multidrug efflux pump subunit AcrA (membrane-fusion protein)
MLRNYRWLLPAAAMVGLLGGISLARHDDNEARRAVKEDKRSEKSLRSKSDTIKVQKGDLKIEVPLKGTVEAEHMIPLSIKPEDWTQQLTVKKSLEHGTPVKKGDVLLEMDAEKIDLAIRDLRLERKLTELAIRQAREELPIAEKSLPLDLVMTERGKKQADEDLKQFMEVDRALEVSDAEQSVKMANFFLENAREELKQLQKMYRDKDLTEETEEIILKRQRFYVELYGEFLKEAKIRRDQTLKIRLPRREQALRDSAEKQSLALEKAKNTLQPALLQKRLALEKLLHEHANSGERLKNLQRDRALFTVRAPADGIVYHGRCVLGQWATASAVEAKLQPGGILQPGEVFMTVVSQRPIFIRADVEEKHLHWLSEGLTCKVVPAGYPDIKMPAQLVKVSAVPQSAGHFDARITLEPSKDSPMLMPGMACSVKLAVYHKKDALTVPVSAVFTDENDDDVHYVYLAGGKGGKPEKRTVKVGKCTSKKMEILNGLKEGEEILSEDPNGKSSLVTSADRPAAEEK